MQETTAQLEHQRQIKEVEAQVEQMKIKQIQIAQEEHRKTLEEQGRISKQRAEYEDQLARRRYVEISQMPFLPFTQEFSRSSKLKLDLQFRATFRCRVIVSKAAPNRFPGMRIS